MRMLTQVVVLLGAALTPAVAAAQAAPVSVDEILSNPDRFDGQMVTVEGTMIDLKRRVSRFGDPVYKFYLSDGNQAIRVISPGSPPCLSGAVMVEGTFAKIKRGLSVHYNVVSASRVICRQGSPGDEPGGGRDPAGGLGGGDDRAREFEHPPRELVVVGHQHVNPARSSALRTVHGPSFGPRLPPLAIHTPRNTTAAVKPKTKSVTPRFVRDGNRDLE
jgi:hypothetical protein